MRGPFVYSLQLVAVVFVGGGLFSEYFCSKMFCCSGLMWWTEA